MGIATALFFNHSSNYILLLVTAECSDRYQTTTHLIKKIDEVILDKYHRSKHF